MKIPTTAYAALAACCVLAPVFAVAQPVSPSLGAAPIGPIPAVQGAAAKRPVPATPPGLSNIAAQPAVAAQAPVASPARPPAPATPAVAAEKPKSSASNGKPSLGDWEDLSEREAYKARHDKLAKDEAKEQQAIAPAQIGPMPNLQPQAPLVPQPEKKRTVFSESCPDDDTPCFFAVYGLSLPDGTNNYRGRLALHGREVSGGVYKGKKFDGYTVVAITGSSLTVTDKSGKKIEWPLRTANDYAADPTELTKQMPSVSGAGFPFPTLGR